MCEKYLKVNGAHAGMSVLQLVRWSVHVESTLLRHATDNIHVRLRTACRTSQPIAVSSVVSLDDNIHWTVYNTRIFRPREFTSTQPLLGESAEKSTL